MISSNCEVGSNEGRRSKSAKSEVRALAAIIQHEPFTSSTHPSTGSYYRPPQGARKLRHQTSHFDRSSLRPSHFHGVLNCAPMPTWKLTIEYKGTRYLGWQEQKQGRTVQGSLRAAAEDYFGEKVDLGGSGRTDAGVHALAQVAHFVP